MASSRRGRRKRPASEALPDEPVEPVVDPWRSIVFPNAVREQRLGRGFAKLLGFVTALPDIPYIRLSKIERGEVFARAEELVRIGSALGVRPEVLLIDIDAPGFDIARWARPFQDGGADDDRDEARTALLVAGALRHLRASRADLTGPVLEAEYGIPPVILSRIENAQKGLDRWNEQTLGALCRLFEVADPVGLRGKVNDLHLAGVLRPFLAGIAGPGERIARTRQRVAELRRELRQLAAGRDPAARAADAAFPAASRGAMREVAVHGASLGEGRIALVATSARIEVPAVAGPRAFGLRVCRPTLGGGLPGQATVVVDPDRFPVAGGLALVRDGEGYRIVAVAIGRDGMMMGYAENPPFEVRIDTLAVADVAAVISALFV